jgi:glycosyltransferase involved in cell wall biosynthesis
MRFSLIVCTLGRCEELAEFFDSLLRQDRADYEVILVDQNTDDRLVNIAERFRAQLPLKHVRMTGTGLSRARNLGLEHASGELIGFPDDDCKYLDGYLNAVDRIFAVDRSIGCITGHPIDCRPPLGDWDQGWRDLDAVSVLNRCQEFTVFVRRENLGSIRYNERMGVGAQTPWGADEGPDFLIRLVQSGCRLVYFPRLFVYHPNKIATITRATLDRAASYARGRGCLFRLHRFPPAMVFKSIFRPAAGCGLYLLRLQPMRSAYYARIVRGTLRGLLMSRRELAAVRSGSLKPLPPLQPMWLPPLPAQPLVSVLIANYNYARFLPAALDSLLAQTCPHWQAVVCDDGSTDDSASIVTGYAQRDSRIALVRKSNGGQTSTVNACYRHLTGQIICLLDADDLFDPRKIASVVQAFAANPQAGVCNHFAKIIDADGQTMSVTLNHHLDAGWLANAALDRGACVYVPTTSCMSMRREVAESLFPIPDSQRRDVDGYLGMAAQFLTPFILLREPLSGYRVHGENMGGLTEPTPRRLRYELDLIHERTQTLKQFLRARFGSAVSGRISLEQNPQYLQAALKLLAIEKADQRRARAFSLIRMHPNPKWRAIWRTIFAAPGPLGRRAVPMMHRSHRLKALVHRLMGRRQAVIA